MMSASHDQCQARSLGEYQRWKSSPTRRSSSGAVSSGLAEAEPADGAVLSHGHSTATAAEMAVALWVAYKMRSVRFPTTELSPTPHPPRPALT